MAGPEFTRKRGSRSKPSGMVYAPMVMGTPPWEALPDRAITCTGAADLGDLGVHTNNTCLSHVDLGSAYHWWRGSMGKKAALVAAHRATTGASGCV